jgi:hypothetical protein
MSAGVELVKNRDAQRECVWKARQLRSELMAECRVESAEALAEIDQGKVAELAEKIIAQKWRVRELRTEYDRLAAAQLADRD